MTYELLSQSRKLNKLGALIRAGWLENFLKIISGAGGGTLIRIRDGLITYKIRHCMKSLHTNTRDKTGFPVWKKAYNTSFLFQISPRLKIKFW